MSCNFDICEDVNDINGRILSHGLLNGQLRNDVTN